MAQVVLLRGVNVGGHRRFRPAACVQDLAHLGAVNIGATGAFVIQRPVSRTALRAALVARLPFPVEIMIFDGREVSRVLNHPVFAAWRSKPGEVRFVSVVSRRPRTMPSLPLSMPPREKWLVRLVACDGRFVLGVYRRDLKVIGYLGALDRIFGVPVTTRNWNTMEAIAKILNTKAKAS